MNLLYYGDNIDVLRRHVDDESVDLIYLDPPFNSDANYNVLFAERDGTKAAAQIQAFGRYVGVEHGRGACLPRGH
jgi:site-specific DNA-methyltransferase (adenine-specific)